MDLSLVSFLEFLQDWATSDNVEVRVKLSKGTKELIITVPKNSIKVDLR